MGILCRFLRYLFMVWSIMIWHWATEHWLHWDVCVCFSGLPGSVLSADVWERHAVNLLLCVLPGLHMCKSTSPLKNCPEYCESAAQVVQCNKTVIKCVLMSVFLTGNSGNEGEVCRALPNQSPVMGKTQWRKWWKLDQTASCFCGDGRFWHCLCTLGASWFCWSALNSLSQMSFVLYFQLSTS